jgi:hypothetical protein
MMTAYFYINWYRAARATPTEGYAQQWLGFRKMCSIEQPQSLVPSQRVWHLSLHIRMRRARFRKSMNLCWSNSPRWMHLLGMPKPSLTACDCVAQRNSTPRTQLYRSLHGSQNQGWIVISRLGQSVDSSVIHTRVL